MANERMKSVGGYVMRLVGGVAVILGILGLFSSLSQANLVGLVLSVVFMVGGAVLLKRSGGSSRVNGVTSVRS